MYSSVTLQFKCNMPHIKDYTPIYLLALHYPGKEQIHK